MAKKIQAKSVFESNIVRLAGVGALLFILGQFVVPIGISAIAQIFPGVLADLTNRDRTLHNLSRLEIDPLLMRAAKLKARDMAARGYFSHEDPEGLSPWRWFDSVGYSYSYAGENLALHYEDSEDVEEAWMESKGHRNNILSEDFRDVGVGIATGTYRGVPATFVVQLFGKRSQ